MRISDWSSDVCSSDLQKLVEKLKQRTGEKTSSLQALGRIERDSVKGRSARHTERWDRLRDEQRADREKRKDKPAAQRKSAESAKPSGLAERIADRALPAASFKIGRASCRERVLSVRVDIGGRRIMQKNKQTQRINKL